MTLTDNRLSDAVTASRCIDSGSMVDITRMTFQTLTIGSDKKYYENRSDYAVLVTYRNVSLKQNSEHINGEAFGGSYANKINIPAPKDKKKEPQSRAKGSVIPMIPPADLRLVRELFDRLPKRGGR